MAKAAASEAKRPAAQETAKGTAKATLKSPPASASKPVARPKAVRTTPPAERSDTELERLFDDVRDKRIIAVRGAR